MVAPGYEKGFRDVFSDILEVDYLSFAIFPDVNPYSKDHYMDNAAQFQPKVSLYHRQLRKHLCAHSVHSIC